MTSPLPRAPGRRPVVLIAGGGIAGVETLLALHALAGDRVQLRMVSASPWFSYRPLAVEEAFGGGPAPKFSLPEICDEHHAEFSPGVLNRVDPERARVFTTDGQFRSFDALVVAVGAEPHSWVGEAATLYGPGFSGRIARFLEEARTGEIESIGFLVPPRTTWSLPVYELALMTSVWAAKRGVQVRVEIFTGESRPLEVFGGSAPEQVQELLDRHGVEVRLGAAVTPAEAQVIDADRLVTLPRLTGLAIDGLPADDAGFIATDEFGRVPGLPNVYGAGDGTDAAIKHGGLASQQADAVAEHVAARAGAAVEPAPFHPTLRAVLLTGEEPLYLRSGLDAGDETSRVARYPLWWPPAKIAARYLSDYLFDRDAGRVGAAEHLTSITAAP